MTGLDHWLTGGGEVAALMRSLDWSKTPIGSVENWSQSLKTALSICLHSPLPTGIWWGDDLIFFYNETWRMSFSASHPQTLGRPGREGWNAVWNRLEPQLQTVLNTGQSVKSEIGQWMGDRPGDWADIDLTCSHHPLVGETGQIQGVFTTVVAAQLSFQHEFLQREQSLRVLSEQNEIRLQEHQHLLEQITDTLPGILYVYDLAEQRNIYVNNQVAELLGYTPSQVQEMGVRLFLQLAHPDDLTTFPEHIRRFNSLRDSEVLENEYRLRNIHGEWRWFSSREIVFSRNANGSPRQIFGIAYDITDRKQAEKALQQEKERFELAASAVDCMIYDWNVKTQKVERSEGLTRIFGFLPTDAEPTWDWWTGRIHPDDGEAVQHQMATALATQNRYAIEYRVRNRFDHPLYVLDQGFVVRDAGGQATRVVGTITDISDRKITERLQQFLLELNNTIRILDYPQDIIWAVVYKVGSYFNVTRCSYCKVNEQQECITISRDFYQSQGNGLEPHPLEDLGAEISSLLRRRTTLAVDDIQTDSRTLPYQEAFAAMNTQAILAVPLVKQERCVALLVLHDSQPRHWSSEAIALTEEVAEQTWAAVEKAHIEQALRQSEARFQRLATNVPGVICRYLLHPNGAEAMPYISPSCRTLFELEAETIQQDVSALWNLVHPEDIQSLRELIAISTQTQQPIHWEGRFETPSGRSRWMQFVARPEQQLDGSVLWDGLLTDITWTKEVEIEREQLLIRSQQYANQLGGLTRAALALNSVLSVEEVLQAITEQAHSIIGTHQATTSLIEDQDWTTAIHAIYLSKKYAKWRDYNVDPNGSGIHACICQLNQPMRLTQAELEAHPRWRGFGTEAANHPPLRGWLAAPLTGRNGQNIGLIQLSDKYEGEFTESDEDILVQLAQMASVAIESTRLYQAEQTARTQAEMANRIKDEFLAVLSHELRSPLNPILGWARLMRSRDLDKRTVASALETIERNAKLQTQLIEDLLDVSRILQGKLSLSICPVDLQMTVRAALETVRLAAEAKRLDLRLAIAEESDRKDGEGRGSRGDGGDGEDGGGREDRGDREGSSLPPLSSSSPLSPSSPSHTPHPTPHTPSPFLVLGDPNRLQQVVWNLLSNAVKFTPTGGTVEIELSAIGALAQIKVTDTGKGIQPDFLPYIFDYFRQEDSATTRKFGGLGLGLAIVRHIVELHGGTVQVENQEGRQGATFIVQLPRLNRAEETSHPASQDSSPVTVAASVLAGVQILVVDDDSDSRGFVVFVLEQAGATVTSVDSAIAALQSLSQSEFDVLVSDIGMPEVDGYMLLRQIRAYPTGKTQQIPAIALTAYAGELNQQQALNAGFQTHLSKPIEPTELIAAVATQVGRAALL